MAKAKSLTEAAKDILEGKSLNEGIYPEVSPGKISNPNPVDPSTASTSNAKTLRPGSGAMEPRHGQNGGGSGPDAFPGPEDLGGATPTSTAKDNLGARASGGKKRDTSVKGSGSNTEPTKKLSAMAEDMEEDGDLVEEEIEISEELADFIEEAIEAGLSEEEIADAIDENFEFVTEASHCEDDEDEEDEDEDEKKSKKKKMDEDLADYEIDMSEHVDALLAGENLSEEFHAKATTIFEAAVKSKLEEEVALLEQAYAETLEETVAQIEEELSAQVDEYLNYVVEQWIEENEVAIESSLRSELTEDFISGLRALFAEHYIDIPEEEVSVVEELAATVEELEGSLNEEIQRNVELSSMLSESRKFELTNVACEGLTTTQAEKLKSLLENVDYNNDEEFIEKVETLRENYFPTAAKNDYVLDRVESQDPQMISESNLEGPMAKYVQAIGKTLIK